MSQQQCAWAFVGFPFIVGVSPSHCFPNCSAPKEQLEIKCRDVREVIWTKLCKYCGCGKKKKRVGGGLYSFERIFSNNQFKILL